MESWEPDRRMIHDRLSAMRVDFRYNTVNGKGKSKAHSTTSSTLPFNLHPAEVPTTRRRSRWLTKRSIMKLVNTSPPLLLRASVTILMSETTTSWEHHHRCTNKWASSQSAAQKLRPFNHVCISHIVLQGRIFGMSYSLRPLGSWLCKISIIVHSHKS